VNPDLKHWAYLKAPDCNAGIHDTFSLIDGRLRRTVFPWRRKKRRRIQIRIRNTGPAGCNARFHITFSYLIIVMAG
jgi:hypothetical protein